MSENSSLAEALSGYTQKPRFILTIYIDSRMSSGAFDYYDSWANCFDYYDYEGNETYT